MRKILFIFGILVSLNLNAQPATSDLTDPVIVPWIGNLSIVYQPDPSAYYPSFSKREGETGTIVLILSINENGDVTSAAVSQSSGFPRLDKAALEIGNRYKFKPYVVNGTSRKVVSNLIVKFNLKSKE